MKRILFITLISLLVASAAIGAGIKITALGNDPTPTTDDLMVLVDNPSGSAVTKKATLQSLQTLMLTGNGENLTGLTQSQITGTMAETNLTFTDVTTNDVTTSAHGFAPKAPNDATKYLDGTGAYSVPTNAAAGGWTDDGANVRLTTVGDNVGIGTASPAVKLDVVGAITATGVITGSSFSGNATTATLATTATALQTNGANCTAGQAPLGVNASGAVEGCFAVLTGASIDTSAELRAILTDETGTGVAVFNTAPTFSGTVTATAFSGDGSALTGLATSFTNSAGLAALMNDETGTGLSVFNDSPTFATMIVLPNAAVPIVDATAEFAFDTNVYAAGRGAAVLYDGTASTTVVAALTSDPPTNGQRPTFNTGGTITWETPSTSGITGTDTHVTFFDGADTPAGDSGFTYNKTTNTATADSFVTTATATPQASFYDSDASAGDVNARILVNCTDTGDGTEDCDVTFSQQVAGTLTPFITADADGSVTIANFSIGAASIDGDDINPNIAGRSLTLTAASPDTLDIDSEIYTDTKCATIETPTSADNFLMWRVPTASTVTTLNCLSEDATSTTIRFDECDADGDNCAGVDGATTVTCAVTGSADDGSLSNPSLDAGDWVRLVVTATSGTPGHVAACLTYTKND